MSLSIKKFIEDRSGLAAVEFGLIMPVLIALLLGSVTVFDFYRADRAISRATNAVVDLAARQTVFDDPTRDAMFASVQGLLGVYATGGSYSVSINSIANIGGTLEVSWSEVTGGASVLTDADLPSLDLPSIPENESVIFLQVNNNYAPIFGEGIDFSREATRRPRFVATIAYASGS